MDSKALTHTLANTLRVDIKTVSVMLNSLSKIITDSANNLSDIAIPSFGTFSPVKYEEEIKTDLVTGKQMLYPPQITVEFFPAASLRKKVLENHE